MAKLTGYFGESDGRNNGTKFTETNLGVTWELAVGSTFAVWKEQIIERSEFAT